MAMKLEQIIDIELNDTMLVIGSIQNIYVDEVAVTDNGQLDLNAIDTVAISGLNRYHKVEEIGNFVKSIISNEIKYLTGVTINFDGGKSNSIF